MAERGRSDPSTSALRAYAQGERIVVIPCPKKKAPLRAPVFMAFWFSQNLYLAVIMTDQRWLGIGTPGVWPSLITRLCGT